jgi:hypothetical protein
MVVLSVKILPLLLASGNEKYWLWLGSCFLCKFVKQKKVDWLSLDKTAYAWAESLKTSASARTAALATLSLSCLFEPPIYPSHSASLLSTPLKLASSLPCSVPESISPSLSLYPSLAASPSSSPPLPHHYAHQQAPSPSTILPLSLPLPLLTLPALRGQGKEVFAGRSEMVKTSGKPTSNSLLRNKLMVRQRLASSKGRTPRIP